jgi:hypothetical protein
MNNSFARLIDGMCATLRAEVLTRLDDDFARGQVFGVINLLHTFKVRADWSAGFLLQQIDAQRQALDEVERLARSAQLAGVATEPALAQPTPTPIAELLALRDEGNRRIGAALAQLDALGTAVPAEVAAAIEQTLRTAMRAEVSLELKNSPRPLFAQMSSGRDD